MQIEVCINPWDNKQMQYYLYSHLRNMFSWAWCDWLHSATWLTRLFYSSEKCCLFLLFIWKMHLIIREKLPLCKIGRYYSIHGISQIAKHFHIYYWFPQITLHSGRKHTTWILFRLLLLYYRWEQWCWERWGDFLVQCSFSYTTALFQYSSLS